MIGVESQRHWPNLCRSLGRDDLIDDERFADGRGRRHNAAALVALLDDEFAFADAVPSWRPRSTSTASGGSPAPTPAEVIDDPQAIAAGAFVDVPAGKESPAHRAVASPVTFHGGMPPVGPVPGLGEHTDTV